MTGDSLEARCEDILLHLQAMLSRPDPPKPGCLISALSSQSNPQSDAHKDWGILKKIDSVIPLFALPSISGDYSFEFYTKLSSTILYFILEVCSWESSSTFYYFWLLRRCLFFPLQSFWYFLRFLLWFRSKNFSHSICIISNFYYFPIPHRFPFSHSSPFPISSDSSFDFKQNLLPMF